MRMEQTGGVWEIIMLVTSVNESKLPFQLSPNHASKQTGHDSSESAPSLALPGVDNSAGAFANIAVVEPRSLLRECIVHFVTHHRNFMVTGYSSIEELTASKGSDAISVAILHTAVPSRQEIFDQIGRLKEKCPHCLIVALIDTSDYGFIRELLQQGVKGVIPTAFPAKVALEALGLVLAGGTFVPADSFLTWPHRDVHATTNDFGLTNREEQIVGLLRSGKPNKQIAYELDLSLGTVKVHLHNIMKKVGARNRMEVLVNKIDSATDRKPVVQPA